MSRLIASSSLAIFVLVFAHAATADTYKCVTGGEVQYTAVPPKGANCERIAIGNNSVTAKAPTQEEPAAPATPEPTSSSKDTSSGDGDINRIRSENCRIARENVLLLTSSDRVRMQDGDKNRVLSELEQKQKLDLAREQQSMFCN